MKKLTRKIATSAICAALLVVGKLALSFIPNVEIVTPLIIVFSSVFALAVSLPATVVFCVADGFIYGFFPLVSLQYFFHFPLLCVASYFVSRKWNKSELSQSILAAVFAILFWLETPTINEIFSFSKFLPTMIAGIPFMLIMLVCNFVVVLLFYKPLVKVLTPFAKEREDDAFPPESNEESSDK